MRESVQAAESFVKSRAPSFGIGPKTLKARISMFMCQKVRRRKTVLVPALQ